MEEHKVDLSVLTPGVNMYYFSGFADIQMDRMLLLLIPVRSEPVFISPELYQGHIVRDSGIVDVDIRVWKDSDNAIELLRAVLSEIEFTNSRVLVDDAMWAIFLLPLKEILRDCSFHPASEILSSLRMIKSQEELQNLEQSAAIADEVFKDVICNERLTGMTELELAAEIRHSMSQKGGEAAIGALVASGPNGANPHHHPGRRIISEGDAVLVDYGCRFNGYWSDISRTLVCGTASDVFRTAYDAVQRAQEKAFQAVRPEIPASEVDRIAREEISRAGFGERFIHRTGHGIGLEMHERPFIVAGNDLILEEGMTFSIEPGVYLPGQFGVRIEDIVVVTSQGGRRLNKSDRNLRVLGNEE